MAPGAATTSETLLRRLARPYDPTRVAVALVGLSPRAARQLVGTAIATSDEAEQLLEAMPHIVRSLAIATTDRPTRCYGELRGPILWSETMSARAASAGDPGLFVCATTTKAYDTHENRVLKAALNAVARAGHDADHSHEPGEQARHARSNGARAARFGEHQTLFAVPGAKASARSRGRTRAGSRRGTYRPALELLRVAADPLRPEHLDAVLDDQTAADHRLLVEVLEAADRLTGTHAPLRSAHGALVAGAVRYHHPRRDGDGHELDGVTVDGTTVASAADVAAALSAG